MDMEDVKQLLTPLLSLLDGTHDVPFPKDKGKGNDLNYQINLLKNLSMIDFQFVNIKLHLQSLSYSSAFLLILQDLLFRIFKRFPENGEPV